MRSRTGSTPRKMLLVRQRQPSTLLSVEQGYQGWVTLKQLAKKLFFAPPTNCFSSSSGNHGNDNCRLPSRLKSMVMMCVCTFAKRRVCGKKREFRIQNISSSADEGNQNDDWNRDAEHPKQYRSHRTLSLLIELSPCGPATTSDCEVSSHLKRQRDHVACHRWSPHTQHKMHHSTGQRKATMTSAPSSCAWCRMFVAPS